MDFANLPLSHGNLLSPMQWPEQYNPQVNKLQKAWPRDVDLLGQAIINLLKNAVDSLSQKDSKEKEGVIQIMIEKKDEITRITISDNGSGIPKDRLDQIFVPFYTSRKKGTGIGLALVKQIVQLHDGTLEVDSVQGEKTSFLIEL